MKPDQRKMLRAKAHALKPVVITGQAGITPAVMNEINQALDHHELIKVRINANDREQRRQMTAQICDDASAELIQSVGHIITLFRKNPNRPA
ncbi:MAG TPA: ribosome assembly RNA-binding protein YhbY [Methylococcaceae bacterium]|nr:ribosome assembly RNA-binding protein YhbY [Methylococcaceae bacterium]